ncbi:MAG: amidohydrolase [Balneolales bacterium]
MDALLKALIEDSRGIENELIHLRHTLHQYPEIGWSEFRTSKTLQNHLVNAGLPTPEQAAGTGFYLDIKGKSGGPIIAYRADIDGLPIQDRKEKLYASRRTGFGHLCGHDVHSTIAGGIARLLHRYRNRMEGSVRIFWQPAEEVLPSGAPRMMKDGVLDNVEAVYGIHCDPTLPSGLYCAQPGAETGSFDTFEVSIDALSTSHSARPHEGKDTIWIAHQIIQHMYQIVGRITDARKPAVISICTFHAGNAMNVIPHHVTFGGTLRTTNEQLRQKLREYIKKMTGEIGSLNGVETKVKFGEGAPAVINNYQLFRFMRTLITSELGDEKFFEGEQSLGAEDFAHYTRKYPGLYLRVGTACSPETSYPLHNAKFDVDERIIAPTAAMMTYALIRHLRDKVLHARTRVSSIEPLLSE